MRDNQMVLRVDRCLHIVANPVVDRLELAAVNRHASLREQAHRPAQHDETGANLADGATAVLAEIGDRLVIWRKAPRQPHYLDITLAFPLKAAARLNAVEVAVNIKFQQTGRMIGRPPRRLGINPPNPSARDLAHRRKRRSHEWDYPRQPNHRGIPEKARPDYDLPPQQSASSDPPQIARES